MGDKTVVFVYAVCIAIGAVLGVIFLVGLIYLLGSAKIVPLNSYALEHDLWESTIGDKTYSSGIYYQQWNKDFILFPREQKYFEASSSSNNTQTSSLSCWTQDGQVVFVDVSLFFILNKEKIRKMYYLHDSTWYATVVRNTVTSIKDTSTKYSTEKFLNERLTISQGFEDEIKTRLTSIFDGAIDIKSFHLKKIKFEESYEEIVQQTLSQVQRIKTAKIVKDMNVKQNELDFEEAKNSGEIQKINSKATYEGNKQVAISQSLQFKKQVTALIDAYENIQTDVGLSSGDLTYKLSFMYLNEMDTFGLNSMIAQKDDFISSI